MPLPRLDRAVAEPGEDLVPRRTAADAFGRSEDALDVDGSVRRGLLGVGDDHLAEVDLGVDRVRGHHPELDEVIEVGELVEPREILFVVGGQRDAVAFRDLEECSRAHRAFEMHVELDLGNGSDGCGTREQTLTTPLRASKVVDAFAANRGLQTLPVWSARDPTQNTRG